MKIKKCKYKRIIELDNDRNRVSEGYCYFLFWTPFSAEGIRIPFSINITKYYYQLKSDVGKAN